jgi:hypothetical protein
MSANGFTMTISLVRELVAVYFVVTVRRKAGRSMKRFRPRTSLEFQRRVVLGIMATSVIGSVCWFASGGLPIWLGPRAKADDIAAGQALFEHEWAANDPLAHGDGLGPVFNARSCAHCHFQGGLGGAGSARHNAVNFEVLPRPGDHSFLSGTIHNFSTTSELKETWDVVRKRFPTVKGKTITETRIIPPDPHCGYPTSRTYVHTTVIPDFEPVSTESVQTTSLFGAGWIDLISDKAIQKNARIRAIKSVAKEMTLEFNAIPIGRIRYTSDGRVGKFGWKGQFASLSDFVAAACANELGLGTPISEQAQPIAKPGMTAEPDLDAKQFEQLNAFVKTLPKPIETDSDRPEIIHGKMLFRQVGCAVCHVPDLGGVSGVYSDFLLYTINDPLPPTNGTSGGDGYVKVAPKELNLPPRPEHLPSPSEWKTPPLWGVADSAPYWHDGSAPTLADAIRRHRGDAKTVAEAYGQLTPDEQRAIITFLNSLKAPTEAIPVRSAAVTRLPKK